MAVRQVFSHVEFTEAVDGMSESAFPGHGLMEDVKKLLGQNSQLLANDQRNKQETQHERLEMKKWKEAVDAKLDLILEHLGIQQPDSAESQSIIGIGKENVSVRKTRGDPFVSLTYPDGNVEAIYVPVTSQRSMMACTKPRQLVRLAMLYMHNDDVKFLQTCTLTGKTNQGASKRGKKRSLEEMDNEAVDDDMSHSSKQELPLRTVLFIQGVIKKLFPISEDIVKIPVEGPKAVSKQTSEVRSYITTTLNYFSGNFNEEGTKMKRNNAK